MTNVKPADPLAAKRWKLLEEIFHQAAQQREPARSALAERLCGSDLPLLAEVQRLFTSLDTLGTLAPNAPPAATRILTGTRLGSYRLGKLLGQGGMSSVYLATRDDGQFEQKVAVKLMSPHLATEFFTERFRRERQILADLDHPNTTRLIDGGVSDTGDPYLVMEYVDGQPINEYCDSRRLPLRECIRLFLQIYAALQYAHHRQVIHRDLKPGNILVTSEGVPKLLDFGTAKLLSPAIAESTTTHFGMMTPRYASPEQLCGEPLSAATDIYSFAVVLFESVTGTWPFGNPNSIIDGLERAAGKVKAARASGVITDGAAAARSTTQKQLASDTKGDLDRILARALESKPEDRYSSIEQLAADLQFFLDGKPPATASRPPWWERRPIQVALALATLAILTASVSYTLFRQSMHAEVAHAIVVLPFITADGNVNDQYLADGLTEDLTDELSRNSTLRVIASPSAARFPGTHPNLQMVSRQLRVGLVLAGQIKRTDTGLNLQTQLERAPTGETIWSHTYHAQGVNLTRVDSEIASSVSSALQAEKNSAAPPEARPVNDQAYDLTQRAAHEMQQASPAAYANAQQELRQAVEIDPQYARASFLLGTLSWNMSSVRGNQIRTNQEVQEAIANWRKALQLAPEFSAARALLAEYDMQYNWNWTLAENELQQALISAPDVNAESTYSFLLLFRRRFTEAESHRRRADELDPASVENLTNSGLFWFQASRFERSLDAFYKLKTQSATGMMTLDYIAQGEPNLAGRVIQKSDRRSPAAPFLRAMVSAAAGRKEEALRIIQQLEAEEPNLNVPRQWFALVYAQIGNETNTVKWLNRSADAHEWQVLNIAVHPFYKNMQSNPEFRALKRRIGLAP